MIHMNQLLQVYLMQLYQVLLLSLALVTVRQPMKELTHLRKVVQLGMLEQTLASNINKIF